MLVVQGGGDAGVAADLGQQLGEPGVAGEPGQPGEPVAQVGGPLLAVPDPGREPVGVQAQSVDVDRRAEQRRVHPFQQRPDGPVGEDDVPPPVQHDRRVGLVAGEQVLQRLASGPGLLAVEVAVGVRRGVAGGQHQGVAFAQRHFELLGQGEQQTAAGL